MHGNQYGRNVRVTVDLKYPHKESSVATSTLPHVVKPLNPLSAASSPAERNPPSPGNVNQGTTISTSWRLRSLPFTLAVLVLATILLSCVNFLYAAGKFRNVSQLQSRVHIGLQAWRTSTERNMQAYRYLLDTNLLMTRALTAGLLFFLADLITQYLNAHNKNSGSGSSLSSSLSSSGSSSSITDRTQLDTVDSQDEFDGERSPSWVWTRSLRYAAYGLVIVGPFLHWWYELTYRYAPGNSLRWALAKAVFESLTVQPLGIALHMVYDSVVRRRSYTHLRQVVKSKFLLFWSANVIYWTPANFANYYIGSQQMRVAFSNSCYVIWHMYFSEHLNSL